MTERSNNANVQSFIVKIWFEEITGEHGKSSWRGHITHVTSGDRCYVKSLDEITNYFQKITQGNLSKRRS